MAHSAAAPCEKEPRGQATGCALPPAQTKPAGHGATLCRGSSPSGVKKPGSGTQATPRSALLPGGHALHSAAPSSDQWSDAQVSQASTPPAAKVPALQSTGAASPPAQLNPRPHGSTFTVVLPPSGT